MKGVDTVSFRVGEETLPIILDGGSETIWANRAQIAEIFGCTVENVRQHVEKIYADSEVDQGATSKKFLEVQTEGERKVRRQVDHYNLDLILAVGYRVNSAKAIEFRRWASTVLTTYLEDGYVLNKPRLEQDAEVARRLSEEIRAIRLSELLQYRAVQEVFKRSSSDYDAGSKAAKTFFATAQDKFHFAATGMTAAMIKMERADHEQEHMGVRSFKGQEPTQNESQRAKNYLDTDELRVLENISEQWMLYAQGKAMRGLRMTMNELLQRINQLLEFNGYDVMWEYPEGSDPKKAEKHVALEFQAFTKAIEAREKSLPGPR